MHDDSLILLDHHHHHLPLLLYYFVAAGFAGSVLAVAFLSWTGVAGLTLLVASAFLSPFFLASFISSLAEAAGVVVVLAGSVANEAVTAKVAIRVAIVFI